MDGEIPKTPLDTGYFLVILYLARKNRVKSCKTGNGSKKLYKRGENAMTTKGIFRMIVALAILVSAFASTGSALAWGGCANYITVQWGDTLSGIAALCGTTVEAIRAANPGLGWWIFAGQLLYIPTGYISTPAYFPAGAQGGTYVVQWGDTLGKIAASRGLSVSSILAVNPQIWNASWIFVGQVINLPAAGSAPAPTYVPAYVPPSGDFSGLLTVTAYNGVNIRDQASYSGSILVRDDFTKGVTYSYRPNSVTYDNAHRRTWVEVNLYNPVNGHSTGWLPVSGPTDPINNTGSIVDWVTPHIQ
jgi:LysM repeat protein